MKLKRAVHNRFLCLLICISLIGSSLPTAVLCIGEDGHITLEAIGSECCKVVQINISHKPLMTSVGSRWAVSKDNCGLCVDIPIVVGFLDIFKKPDRVSPIFLAYNAINPVIIDSYDSSECLLVNETLAIRNPSLAFLRSTILLI